MLKSVAGVCLWTVWDRWCSLLMNMCGKLLEVGHRQRGFVSVGKLLLLVHIGGCMTICEMYLSCPLSRRVSNCLPFSDMIGLIVSMVSIVLVESWYCSMK